MKWIKIKACFGSLCLGAVTLAGASNVLRAEDIAAGMREQGAASYLEKLMESNAILKSALSIEVRSKMLGHIDALKAKKELNLNVKSSQPTGSIQVDFALVEYADLALLVSVTQHVIEGKAVAFGLGWDPFPDGLSETVGKYFSLLPDFEPGPHAIEAGKKALEASIKAKDLSVFYKQAEDAYAKCEKAPQFLKNSLGRLRETAMQQNGMFKAVNIRAQATYACSKALTDNAFISLYAASCDDLPGVYVVLFYLAGKEPLIAGSQGVFGGPALPFLVEMGRQEKLSARK